MSIGPGAAKIGEAVECGKSPHALTRVKGFGYLQSAIRIRSALEEGER